MNTIQQENALLPPECPARSPHSAATSAVGTHVTHRPRPTFALARHRHSHNSPEFHANAPPPSNAVVAGYRRDALAAAQPSRYGRRASGR